MDSSECNHRQTKYCKAIIDIVEKLHHATNSQIQDRLKSDFPEISATTIHRVTNRLSSRGIIGIAPSDNVGSIRYDKNTEEHDHFQCLGCGKLVDIDIKESVAPLISASIKDCCITGRLIINGTCPNCK